MSNKIVADGYTGIETIKSITSINVITNAFGFGDIINIQSHPPKNKLVKPKGGVTMRKHIDIKRITAVIFVVFFLVALWSLFAGKLFSQPGSILIILFSLIFATLFWRDSHSNGSRV